MSTVQTLSQSCINGFQYLLSSLRGTEHRFLQQIPPSKIEIQLGKFRVWCGNLGALQTGYSSLDYRLRESALMHRNLSQLLQQLGIELEESTAVVQGKRLPFDEESMPSDISEESDDDTSNEYFGSTELSMRVTSVTEILNNLYRLSYKIRNSSLRPSSTRASLIRAVDNETGINLFDTLYEFDSRHLIELFTAMRQGKREEVESSNVLLERLTTSNVLRRKQFRYWERHAQKLAIQVLPVRQVPGRERSSASEVPEDLGLPQAQQLELPPPVAEQSYLSETNATPYDPARDDRTERETVLSLASTALDADGKGIEVPKPPEDALNGDSFTCPYCWVVCPSKQGRGKAWKSHVLHDLRPYVCTYEACNSAKDLYQSRQAWVDHEEAVHRPSWRCRDHPDAWCVSSASFRSHLLLEHDRGLSGQQLEDLTNVSKLGRVDDRDTCPICFEEQPFPKGLTNHLANHLERIALFSLPMTISNQEKNMDESQFSKLFNIDSDDSSTPAQFEEEEEKEEEGDPSVTERKTTESLSCPPELDELLRMLQYCLKFFMAIKNDLIVIRPNLGGHDRLLDCNLGAYVTAKDGDSLTEILRHIRRFLDTTRKELDKFDDYAFEDQENQIALVTEVMGGLGTVHDILEGILQVLQGSISLTTGLGKIGEYQSVLTNLLPTEVEPLDPRYQIAPPHMFQPGEVFKVLWPIPSDGGETISVSFRRFIIVANDSGHCICLSISTYGGKGLKKEGVNPQSHAIVCESGNRSPQLLQGEPTPGYPPLRVHIYEEGERIHKASRICYSKLTTVQHDVKVLFIGRVMSSDWDIVCSAVNDLWEKKTRPKGKGESRTQVGSG